ncbi:MAG TPA: hypothetical protein VHU85_02715 [Acidimicrobiales bacterium]|jgi:hypothetical protein|nr:hypothetical protein [Acidimicrobiales bacterium]
MTIWIIAAAGLVTATSAVRSTWSPCGLSMLASITPLAETGRGNRFRTTATWFVIGSTVGGLSLGTGMAALAAGVHALALSPTTIGIVALAAAALAVGSDTGVTGIRLPVHYRQVNERWLDQFRPWVYAAGFGWQIGTGLATYITTSAIYLMVVLAALAGHPVWAIALGAGFGLVRGLSVLLGRNITNPDALRAFHFKFYAAGPKVGRITVIAEMVAAGTVGWALSPVVGISTLAVVAIAALLMTRRRGQTETPADGTRSGAGVASGDYPVSERATAR